MFLFTHKHCSLGNVLKKYNFLLIRSKNEVVFNLVNAFKNKRSN